MPTLYKYLPPDRSAYLDDELLRFTQPSALNDPFECIPVIPLVDPGPFLDGVIDRNRAYIMAKYGTSRKGARTAKKAILLAKAELRRTYKRDPQYLPNLFLKRYLFHTNNTLGIFSLSRRWNSTLMWSHYCAAHSGFLRGIQF